MTADRPGVMNREKVENRHIRFRGRRVYLLDAPATKSNAKRLQGLFLLGHAR